MRDTERQRHKQREKQAPCREPNVGLDPRSPGSRPGHLGCPKQKFLKLKIVTLTHINHLFRPSPSVLALESEGFL